MVYIEDGIEGIIEPELDEIYEKSEKFRKMLYDLPLTEEEITALIHLDCYREDILKGEDPNKFYSDVAGARRRFENTLGTVLEGIWREELKMYENLNFRRNMIAIYKQIILPMLEKEN